jgi:uncharacterized protein with NRDE domain
VCTLLVAFKALPGAPLVVAANRDERLDRPAEPPRVWPGEVPFVAPRDLEGGGSWLGLNARGLFVGITNRFGVRKDDARRSRGELVTSALTSPSARELHARLASLPADRYNAFHLLYADANHAFVTWCDGARMAQETLGHGVHVVTERAVRVSAHGGRNGGSDGGRTERLLAEWTALRRPPSAEDLEALLRIHGETSPIEGTCVHVPQLGYGTRSSMVLFVEDPPDRSRMLWAEGPPCVTPYVKVAISFS